jgi:hypothetical protein
MITIKKFGEFNSRRFGNPWVARVGSDGKINFSVRVGGYTGGYNKGEAGSLYISNPVDGAVYAYGQKDYRGSYTYTTYCKYTDGGLTEIEKTNLVEALQG